MPATYTASEALNNAVGQKAMTSSIAVVVASDQTSVRTSAGYVAPNQTAKSYQFRQATSTTATTTIALAAVTTGKTMIFTDIFLSTDSAGSLDIQLQAAGSNIFRTFIRDAGPCNGAGIETQPSGSSGQALQVVLPQTAGGVVNVIGSLYGIEQ